MPDTEMTHRLLKFDLIARASILAQALTTCLLGWFVDTSLTAKLAHQGAAVFVVALAERCKTGNRELQ